jgi:hypothetical protein
MMELREAFTPRQPKRWRHLFVGRDRQIERAVAALEDEQAHLVFYGDRGRGKTSLANVLAEMAIDNGHLVLRCAGSADLGFEALFRNALAKIPGQLLDIPLAAGESLALRLPEHFGATELADIVRHIVRGRVLIVIDEFDRIADPQMRNQLAEAIKSLSDARARLHLMIVGVASSLEELLGAHPSIQRNVVGIHVPLMAPDEVRHLVESAASAVGITFAAQVADAITEFAKGLPYYVQLFGLYSARNAMRRGSTEVGWGDLADAIRAILEEADPAMIAAYEMASAGVRGRWGPGILANIAAADADAVGVFGPMALNAALCHLREREREPLLSFLCSEAGGALLTPTTHGPSQGFVFASSTMRQYVLLRDFIRRAQEATGAVTSDHGESSQSAFTAPQRAAS